MKDYYGGASVRKEVEAILDSQLERKKLKKTRPLFKRVVMCYKIIKKRIKTDEKCY